MVRSLLAAIAACSLALTVVPAKPALAEERHVGDVMDKVLATDIEAYVNGKKIPSMNIRGYTAVTAEDLRAYGFDVAWSPRKRTLRLEENKSKAVTGVPPAGDAEPLPVGAKIKDVLYTDIRAEVAASGTGVPIDSYNIDGSTAIMLNDLAPFGTLTWDETGRRLSFQSAARYGESKMPAEPADAPVETLRLKQTSTVEKTLDFREDGQYDGDKKVGVGIDGLAFLELNHFAEEYGYTLTTSKKTYTADEGLYLFEVTPGSLEARLYWGGSFDRVLELYKEPFVREGKLYVYSIDMERLFGYTAAWDQDAKKLAVRYDRFDVEDFGLPASAAGDRLTVRGKVLELAPRTYTTQDMMLSLDNTGVYGNAARAAYAQRTEKEMHVSGVELDVPLMLGDNSVSERLSVGARILYKTEGSVRTSFERIPLSVAIEGFKLDGMEQGIVRSGASDFTFTGTSPAAFRATAAKWEGRGFWGPSAQIEVKRDESGRFELPLILAEDGLYIVTLLQLESRPRAGLVPISKGYFYILRQQ